jgi:hypothetical protein
MLIAKAHFRSGQTIRTFTIRWETGQEVGYTSDGSLFVRSDLVSDKLRKSAEPGLLRNQGAIQTLITHAESHLTHPVEFTELVWGNPKKSVAPQRLVVVNLATFSLLLGIDYRYYEAVLNYNTGCRNPKAKEWMYLEAANVKTGKKIDIVGCMSVRDTDQHRHPVILIVANRMDWNILELGAKHETG